jgi:hypothetical protein
MPTAAADNLPAAIASPLEKGVQTATVTVGHAFDLETGDSYAPAPDAVPWGPAGGEEWDFALFALFMNGTHSNHANMYVNWADGETAAYPPEAPACADPTLGLPTAMER